MLTQTPVSPVFSDVTVCNIVSLTEHDATALKRLPGHHRGATPVLDARLDPARDRVSGEPHRGNLGQSPLAERLLLSGNSN